MSIRIHPTKGPGWWYIQFRPDGSRGKLKTIPFKGTKAEAHAWELEIRKQVRPARDVLSVAPSLSEILPEFIASYRMDHQPGGAARTIRSFEILLPVFGRLPLTAITARAIEDYKAQRLAQRTARSKGEMGVKPTTINKELAALSGLLKWAAEMGYCYPIKIKRFPPKLTRAPLPSVPTTQEVQKIINAAPWPKSGLLACLYYGGLRSVEARELKAEQVRIDQGVIFVVGKGNKERIVPIIPPLAAVLSRRLGEVSSGYLWTWPPGNRPIKDLRGTLKWACKRAGISRHITPHLFRHAFGVQATIDKAGTRGLQQIMGHSSIVTTEIYTRLAASHLKDVLTGFGDGFNTMINPEEEKSHKQRVFRRKTRRT